MSEKQTTPPMILLIEPDDETRPLLKFNLGNWGYQIRVALDEEDAIERCNDFRSSVDLILMNQFKLPLDQVITSARGIRQLIQLPSHTPIVILAEQYGEDMEGQNIQVGDHEYVTYLEDGQQLRSLLQHLCPV